eukprot:gi/632962452/ref/XP_007897322.1/ PREDICTED: uncharacterized protein LOC103182212 [Callorhinchus milii]
MIARLRQENDDLRGALCYQEIGRQERAELEEFRKRKEREKEGNEWRQALVAAVCDIKPVINGVCQDADDNNVDWGELDEEAVQYNEDEGSEPPVIKGRVCPVSTSRRTNANGNAGGRDKIVTSLSPGDVVAYCSQLGPKLTQGTPWQRWIMKWDTWKEDNADLTPADYARTLKAMLSSDLRGALDPRTIPGGVVTPANFQAEVRRALAAHSNPLEDLTSCKQGANESPLAFHLRLWQLYSANQENAMNRQQCENSVNYKKCWLGKLNKNTSAAVGLGIDPASLFDQLIAEAMRCHGAIQKTINSEKGREPWRPLNNGASRGQP